jgi:hypothetical protein
MTQWKRDAIDRGIELRYNPIGQGYLNINSTMVAG